MQSKYAGVLTVRCTTCGANQGERCRTEGIGLPKPERKSHKARFTAYDVALEADVYDDPEVRRGVEADSAEATAALYRATVGYSRAVRVLGKHNYEGTVPGHVVKRRRAKNKVAKQSRKRNRA